MTNELPSEGAENRICPSCGGVIGRDCFNPRECQWITDQMERDEQDRLERRSGYANEKAISEHENRESDYDDLPY